MRPITVFGTQASQRDHQYALASTPGLLESFLLVMRVAIDNHPTLNRQIFYGKAGIICCNHLCLTRYTNESLLLLFFRKFAATPSTKSPSISRAQTLSPHWTCTKPSGFQRGWAHGLSLNR